MMRIHRQGRKKRERDEREMREESDAPVMCVCVVCTSCACGALVVQTAMALTSIVVKLHSTYVGVSTRVASPAVAVEMVVTASIPSPDDSCWRRHG